MLLQLLELNTFYLNVCSLCTHCYINTAEPQRPMDLLCLKIQCVVD
jgi:hypothetical protein